MINIVLHEPEIPENTGNIGRTCVATGSSLHLIDPLGFHLNEKSIKRAGMDYWDKLDVHRYIDYEDFLKTAAANAGSPDKPRIWYATTKAEKSYIEAAFAEGDYIMFGKESAGIPEQILVDNRENCIRIPMLPDIRSLNLANSVAIVLYEALRQLDFKNFQTEGRLHHLNWNNH